jgi:hypothetical protein
MLRSGVAKTGRHRAPIVVRRGEGVDIHARDAEDGFEGRVLAPAEVPLRAQEGERADGRLGHFSREDVGEEFGWERRGEAETERGLGFGFWGHWLLRSVVLGPGVRVRALLQSREEVDDTFKDMG